MRLGWIALIIGLGTTVIGWRTHYEAGATGEKKDIAYARLVEEMPGLGWYRVTGASYSLIDAVTLRGLTGKTPEDVYVRVHADGAQGDDDAPARLLVHIRDQQLANRMADLHARAFEEPYLLDDTKLMEEYPIEGMIESVLTIDRTDLRGVRKALGERLAGDYLVIAQGEKPGDESRGILLLAIGLALLGLSALLLLRGRRTPPAEEPAAD